MTRPLLDLDAADLDRCFGVRPFTVRHALADHPALAPAAIRRLVEEHPERLMEWNRGSVHEHARPDEVPSNGITALETVDSLDVCDSWIVLKRVESAPALRDLLAGTVDELRPALARRGLHPFRLRAFLFLSSPGAVTPLHIDPEENFLLQVRGAKEMTLFGRDDRELVPEDELERFAAGAHRNLERRPGPDAEGTTFRLEPGTGLHVPLHAPHFVKNGDGVSVSLSITFMTEEADRERSVLLVNHRLRRLGLAPAARGARPRLDGAKHALVRTFRAALGRGK